MAVAIALWSCVLKPGQKEVVQPAGDLRITNVALGDKLEDETSRTSVKFTFSKPIRMDEDEEDEDEDENALTSTILCSLTPAKVLFSRCVSFLVLINDL
jgi:FK506-binding nuclear protein